MLYAALFGEAVTLDVSCAGHIKNDRPEKHNTRLAFHRNVDTQNRKDAERTRWRQAGALYLAGLMPASTQKAKRDVTYLHI